MCTHSLLGNSSGVGLDVHNTFNLSLSNTCGQESQNSGNRAAPQIAMFLQIPTFSFSACRPVTGVSSALDDHNLWSPNVPNRHTVFAGHSEDFPGIPSVGLLRCWALAVGLGLGEEWEVATRIAGSLALAGLVEALSA